ncbi:MAG: sigma-70 family RNA polymerase sigma factor [Synechococcaceae cyanobacterium]
MARVLRCIASPLSKRPPAGQLDLPLHPRVVATCLPRRRLPPRSAKPPAAQHAVQLVIAYPSRPRRHRPVNPHAAANALALQHRDIAQTVAANISRRTGHPRDDLEQIAMIGMLQAARRFSPERGSCRPYARTSATGVVSPSLRDKGFLIKVPASWRELHARGQKLLRLGTPPAELPERLGIGRERWEEIVVACSQKVVAMEGFDQG